MYNATVLDHFRNPRNVGTLDGADGAGIAGTEGHGNFMVIHINIHNNAISEIRYRTYGCPAAIACGSALTEMVTGLAVEDALKLTEVDLMKYLGGLPRGKKHCLGIAVDALTKAIENFTGNHGNCQPAESSL